MESAKPASIEKDTLLVIIDFFFISAFRSILTVSVYIEFNLRVINCVNKDIGTIKPCFEIVSSG